MSQLRAFPVIYTEHVSDLRVWYESLGFTFAFGFPPGDNPGYVSLQRGDSTLGIVSFDSPQQLLGVTPGPGPRFEMFIYVDDLNDIVARLRQQGTTVLREPTDMPWGERLAYVTDPDGNPVALAQAH